MRAQLIDVGLDPLDGTQQTRLLAIPGAIDDGALRVPALAMQGTEHARLLQHGRETRYRVVGAVDPRVMVVAANHPLISKLRAGEPRDHVVDGLDIPVGRHLQVHAGRARPHVIVDGQCPAPLSGRFRPLQCLQQRQRIGIGDRQHRNARERARVLQGQAFGVGGCSHAGRQGIARILGVHDTAALHATLSPPAAGRKLFAREIAVAPGVRIDDATDGTVLGRHLGLDAAPAVAVARNDNGALHRDAQPVEHLVVVAVAVVDVDQWRRDITVRRVGVVGGQLLGGLLRSGIHRNHRFAELRPVAGRLQHLEHAHARRREQYIEGLDLRIETPLAEPGEHPLGVVLVIGRAHVVRPSAQAPHVFADIGGSDAILESLLPGALLAGACSAIAQQFRRRRRSVRRRRARQQRGDGQPGQQQRNRVLQELRHGLSPVKAVDTAILGNISSTRKARIHHGGLGIVRQ